MAAAIVARVWWFRKRWRADRRKWARKVSQKVSQKRFKFENSLNAKFNENISLHKTLFSLSSSRTQGLHSLRSLKLLSITQTVFHTFFCSIWVFFSLHLVFFIYANTVIIRWKRPSNTCRHTTYRRRFELMLALKYVKKMKRRSWIFL